MSYSRRSNRSTARPDTFYKQMKNLCNTIEIIFKHFVLVNEILTAYTHKIALANYLFRDLSMKQVVEELGEKVHTMTVIFQRYGVAELNLTFGLMEENMQFLELHEAFWVIKIGDERTIKT